MLVQPVEHLLGKQQLVLVVRLVVGGVHVGDEQPCELTCHGFVTRIGLELDDAARVVRRLLGLAAVHNCDRRVFDRWAAATA